MGKRVMRLGIVDSGNRTWVAGSSRAIERVPPHSVSPERRPRQCPSEYPSTDRRWERELEVLAMTIPEPLTPCEILIVPWSTWGSSTARTARAMHDHHA